MEVLKVLLWQVDGLEKFTFITQARTVQWSDIEGSKRNILKRNPPIDAFPLQFILINQINIIKSIYLRIYLFILVISFEYNSALDGKHSDR